jgi:hypothetical protein
MDTPSPKYKAASPLVPRSRLLAIAALSLILAPAPAQTPNTPQTVTGSVLDAVTSQPIFRALVRLGGGSAQRAVLTDSQGHFTFPAVDPAALTISVTKPGYNFAQSSDDPNEVPLKPEALADPVLLHLYPEAILKGTVSDSSGDPLPDIPIDARRSLSDDSGHRWITTAVTRSNSHGQFRLPVSAGDYRIVTGYAKASSSCSAIMPSTYPPPSTLLQTQAIQVHPGEQLNLDLRPVTTPLIEVTARLENSNIREINLLTAIFNDGTSFPVPFTQTGSASIRATLPVGSYILEARRRNYGADGVDQASINLAPSQEQPVSLTLQFAPVATIPLDVSIDDASSTAAATAGQTLTPPNPQALGLILEPSQASSSLNSQPLRPTQHREGDTSFSASAGTYRLRARPARTWFILSATYGGIDLLSRDLLIAAGSGSSPIQIVVSNQAATLKGSITLSGKPAACWLYLLPTTPSATPILTLHSGTDGTFNDTFVPPGSYRAIAFEHRHPLDPDNPDALAPFSSHLAAVTLQPGDKSTLNLEAVPDTELHP